MHTVQTDAACLLQKIFMKLIQVGRQKGYQTVMPYHYDYCKGAISNPNIVSHVKVNSDS